MSKHSSQLSSPHHLSTHRLLPDVSLVPEEVCLHIPWYGTAEPEIRDNTKEYMWILIYIYMIEKENTCQA